MNDNVLIQEKINQAAAILEENNTDLWLTFVRETSAGGDPVLPLIYNHDLTWQSALIITRSGRHIAIVGRHEVDAANQLGTYEVIGYDEGISGHLISVLEELKPNQIAVNTSTNDVLADGLTHGMYQLLQGYLANTSFAEKLVSSEPIIAALRSRKTETELERISQAIKTTEMIYNSTFEFMRPGMTEIEVGEFMHALVDRFQLETAWERASCPAVNAGPDTPVGHGAPTEIVLERGQIVHFDFGVNEVGYCSDIQRVAYILRENESNAPEEVLRGFKTIADAIQIAVDAIRPGMKGVEVDEIARSHVIEAGYPSYKYATGHQMGRIVHDGGALIGPRWERYGNLPDQLLEAGQVFRIEPGLMVLGYGYIGIEEDIVITETGAEFLSIPQKSIVLIKSA